MHFSTRCPTQPWGALQSPGPGPLEIFLNFKIPRARDRGPSIHNGAHGHRNAFQTARTHGNFPKISQTQVEVIFSFRRPSSLSPINLLLQVCCGFIPTPFLTMLISKVMEDWNVFAKNRANELDRETKTRLDEKVIIAMCLGFFPCSLGTVCTVSFLNCYYCSLAFLDSHSWAGGGFHGRA